MKDPLIGQRFGNYEIRELVANSSLFGTYKAVDINLGHTVLLKVIASSLSPELREKFDRESRSLAELSHPNIIRVLDGGSQNEYSFLVSEYVSGTSLAQKINRPMPWDQAVKILLPITDALLYAHSRGFNHQNLTPENIIIVQDKPQLSDFQLVKIIEEEVTSDLTTNHVGIGSPTYWSPEKSRGEEVDIRSDIYSLGTIFYEMVTGRTLFQGNNGIKVILKHITSIPTNPRKLVPYLPHRVERVILKALSKDPAKRHQSMDEFSKELQKLLISTSSGFTFRQIRLDPLWVVLGIAVLLLVTGLFLIRSDQTSQSNMTSTSPAPSKTMETTPISLDITVTLPAELSTNSFLPTETTVGSVLVQRVLPGEPLPVSAELINPENILDLIEMARWGIPDFRELAFINNNQSLVAATSAGIYFLRTTDLSVLRIWDAEGALTAIAVSKDESWVVTGDEKGVVTIWNVEDGRKIDQFRDQLQAIQSLDISPDGKSIIFSDTNQQIYLWSPQTNAVLTFRREHSKINKIKFSQSGDLIYSTGDDFKIVIWDLAGVIQKKFTTSQKVNDISISSDGHYLAAAMDFSKLAFWDLTTGQQLKIIDNLALANHFKFVRFFPNGENVLAGSLDGRLWIFNIFSTSPIWEVPIAGSENSNVSLKTLAMGKKGSDFLVMLANGQAQVWDYSTRSQISFSNNFDWSPIVDLAITSDNKWLAVQKGEFQVELFSTIESGSVADFIGALPNGYPISPNDELIALQAEDLKQLNLFKIEKGTRDPLFTLYNSPVYGKVNFSSNSKIIISSNQERLTYWSTVSGLELEPDNPKRQDHCIVLHKRGAEDDFLIASSDAGVIYLDENLESFCQVPFPEGVTGGIYLLDGHIVAQIVGHNHIEIWNLRQGKEQVIINLPASDQVTDIALSPSGQLLAAGSQGGIISFYELDLATNTPVHVLNLRTGPIHRVLFSPDGKYFIAGLDDGTFRFYGIGR